MVRHKVVSLNSNPIAIHKFPCSGRQKSLNVLPLSTISSEAMALVEGLEVSLYLNKPGPAQVGAISKAQK